MIIARTLRPKLLTRLIALLGLAAAGAVAAPVQAQADPTMFMGFSEHDYLHRDMVIFAQGLNLDDGQRMIVESLYEDYRDAFDAGWLGIQDRIQNLQHMDQSDPMAVLDEVLKSLERWGDDKQRIKVRFEEDVKVLLNPDQLDRWEAFQRRITREKTLPQAQLSGENVNLLHIVRDLHLDDRTMLDLEPVMLQYDLALDEALRRRNESLREGQHDLFSAIREKNITAGADRVERQIQRRVEVREVNDRYLDLIAGYLPETKRGEFRTNSLERGYPRVFGATPAQRVFREAMRLTGIEPDVMQGVLALNAAMSAEMDSLNTAIHAVLKEHEPKAIKNRNDIFIARQGGERIERLPDPTHEMIRSRDVRGSEYVEQLRDLLGLEQFARIPGSARWVVEAHRAEHGYDGGGGALPRQRGDAPSVNPTAPQPRDGGEGRPRRSDEN